MPIFIFPLQTRYDFVCPQKWHLQKWQKKGHRKGQKNDTKRDTKSVNFVDDFSGISGTQPISAVNHGWKCAQWVPMAARRLLRWELSAPAIESAVEPCGCIPMEFIFANVVWICCDIIIALFFDVLFGSRKPLYFKLKTVLFPFT